MQVNQVNSAKAPEGSIPTPMSSAAFHQTSIGLNASDSIRTSGIPPEAQVQTIDPQRLAKARDDLKNGLAQLKSQYDDDKSFVLDLAKRVNDRADLNSKEKEWLLANEVIAYTADVAMQMTAPHKKDQPWTPQQQGRFEAVSAAFGAAKGLSDLVTPSVARPDGSMPSTIAPLPCPPPAPPPAPIPGAPATTTPAPPTNSMYGPTPVPGGYGQGSMYGPTPIPGQGGMGMGGMYGQGGMGMGGMQGQGAMGMGGMHGQGAMGMGGMHGQGAMGMGGMHGQGAMGMGGMQGQGAMGMGGMQGQGAMGMGGMHGQGAMGMGGMQGQGAMGMGGMQGQGAMGMGMGLGAGAGIYGQGLPDQALPTTHKDPVFAIWEIRRTEAQQMFNDVQLLMQRKGEWKQRILASRVAFFWKVYNMHAGFLAESWRPRT